MHSLIPFIPGSINDTLSSIPFFLPEIYLTVLFILVLVTDLLFGRNSEKLCRIIAFAGLLLVIQRDYQQISLLFVSGRVNGQFLFGEMLLLNRVAINFKLIIDALAAIMVLCFEWDNRLKAHRKGLSDLYSIAIGSVLAVHLMTMAVNLLSIYLAIEMVSIASYLMVAYRSETRFSAEAGLKYVLFGAASSAIMLYGISLLYGFGGSLNLFSGNLLPGLMQANPLAVALALGLVLIGIGFKLSFVPVHFWVPDVYEGAPTPVTAWLSTLPKIAAFALLINFLRPFIYFEKWNGFDFKLVLSIIGIITMIAGNFAAVLQKNVKRMLAYSSIGHTGFALMAVVTYNSTGVAAVIFYLAVYGLANIGALALATYFANALDADDISSYKGLGLKHPAASICFVIVLISLTGLPVSAGFTGKVFVFSSVYSVYQHDHNIWLLLLMITGALTTVVSLFYYIKIPLNLFLKRTEILKNTFTKSQNVVVFGVFISVLIILLGIWPQMLSDLL
ncbi:NADH-quinone oxidoreductase subunit N [Mucilaginibacter sp. L3T2-6]|uniref:NADH-quinone oxidoreductase subunit N n=1 Tax=Mucilaginibacter sp. L3T2-6 TaxID=3062491 RepID=UPI00267603D4|nr:NADH-quinone oxidoreductase subunit N [Mucilaginibacter sp. L3T2-6]MDO3644522.1 NADH-quinone oxidoreductase subunit N [Mucilaginibacter sp. L3T2-6]MDV6216974.1 NADH-quinone oxidoreductase subunit N [Mucilaginibacter sp. L3T2-6]